MLVAAILASLLAAGCGSSGHSADPPAAVVAVAGDGVVTVSWSMASGVDYWLFYANSSSISTSNWTTIPGSQSVIGAASPYVAAGLSNGAIYSFTINGRTNGGPGGEGTPSVSAIPRLAGTATASLPAPWTAGTALGANDMRGVMWGTVFVAVGANGAMYSSPDGTQWTALNSGVAGNLNAAVYGLGAYMTVGDGGVMLYSTDAATWTAQNNVSANNLYSIASNQVNLSVAVGANGTILTSSDGKTWVAAASSGTATTQDLRAVTYSALGTWVAVGSNGTLITSTDASNWKAVASNTASDLKGIAYGLSSATNAAIFVAVGANGTLVTSPDAVTWTKQPAIGPSTLFAVTHSAPPSGTQFIAVGAGGSIFTSTDGTTWAGPQPSTTSSDLKAIVHATYSYSVVGAAGVNLLAK
jgi:photosystem II stability/assembly factor-like uncharacterized protein